MASGHVALGDEGLKRAMEAGNIARIKDILSRSSCSLDIADSRGYGLLHHAAFHGENDLVTALLRAGVNVNGVSLYGESPLHIALCQGQEGIAQILINSHADLRLEVKEGEHKGYTMVESAASGGCVHMTKWLLDQGMDEGRSYTISEMKYVESSKNCYKQIRENLANYALQKRLVESIRPVASGAGEGSGVVSDLSKSRATLGVALVASKFNVCAMMERAEFWPVLVDYSKQVASGGEPADVDQALKFFIDPHQAYLGMLQASRTKALSQLKKSGYVAMPSAWTAAVADTRLSLSPAR